MTSRELLDRWLKFWFDPQSPTTIALFRLCFGLLVLDAALFHIGPDVLDWYGPHGVTSADSVHHYWWLNEPRFDIFLIAPNTDTGIMFLWYIFVVSVVCLMVGFRTKMASIIVCLYLISMDNRQPFAINGGDAMMRILSGYLIFVDAGAALSVDRLIKRWKNPTFGEASRPNVIAPVGQRMIQVQMAITYWSTICAKFSGAQWWDGTAVYYATRLDDMINHTLFLYDNLWFCKFLTWYTLFVEAAMFSLVWLKDLRYYVLAGTIIMHLGIDYSINLPIFEWIFMSSFITFVYPDDLTKCMNFIKSRVSLYFGPATALVYNPGVAWQKSLASVIEGLDVLGRLDIKAESEQPSLVPAAPARVHSLVAMTPDNGDLTGSSLFAWLTARLPLLWIFYPLIGLPWESLHRKPVLKSDA